MNSTIGVNFLFFIFLWVMPHFSHSITKDFQQDETTPDTSVVTCPDGKSTCPDKFTCCPGSSKPWVCCAYYKGSCCKDGVHCCPRDTRCDEKEHRCSAIYSFMEAIGSQPSQTGVHKMSQNTQQTDKTEMSEMTEHKNEEEHSEGEADSVFSVECPDHRKFCPNNYTCCKTTNSAWACCEFRHGTCCPDGAHCCPRGFKCDEKSKACVVKDFPFIAVQPIRTISAQKYEPEGLVDSMVEPSRTNISVECPDRKLFCPDNHTCCRMFSESTGWGCCNFKHGVCCSDGKSCCPENYTCDALKKACIQKDHIVPRDLTPGFNTPTSEHTPRTNRQGGN